MAVMTLRPGQRRRLRGREAEVQRLLPDGAVRIEYVSGLDLVALTKKTVEKALCDGDLELLGTEAELRYAEARAKVDYLREGDWAGWGEELDKMAGVLRQLVELTESQQ